MDAVEKLLVISLTNIKPSQIAALRERTQPHPIVRNVLEAVCFLMGVKPILAKSALGARVMDFWAPARQLMGNASLFLRSLREFDMVAVSKARIKNIRNRFVNNEAFDPTAIHHVSSTAAALCKWVLAVELHHRVRTSMEQHGEDLASVTEEVSALTSKLMAPNVSGSDDPTPLTFADIAAETLLSNPALKKRGLKTTVQGIGTSSVGQMLRICDYLPVEADSSSSDAAIDRAGFLKIDPACMHPAVGAPLFYFAVGARITVQSGVYAGQTGTVLGAITKMPLPEDPTSRLQKRISLLLDNSAGQL